MALRSAPTLRLQTGKSCGSSSTLRAGEYATRRTRDGRAREIFMCKLFHFSRFLSRICSVLFFHYSKHLIPCISNTLYITIGPIRIFFGCPKDRSPKVSYRERERCSYDFFFLLPSLCKVPDLMPVSQAELERWVENGEWCRSCGVPFHFLRFCFFLNFMYF